MPHKSSLIYIRKGGKAVKKREMAVQRAITRYLMSEYPQVDFFNDWASGAYLTTGQNAARLSIQPKTGWSDLFIPYPSRGYHGLFLELKKEGTTIYKKIGPEKGQMVADQQIRAEAEFIERMNKLGYLARFAVGYDKATEIIDWYMERPENLEMF